MLLECKTLTVDCEANDSVDIRAGGPKYLGYDFYVSLEDSKDIDNFIKEELKKNNQNLIEIRCIKELKDESLLWSKEKIAECIRKGY